MPPSPGGIRRRTVLSALAVTPVADTLGAAPKPAGATGAEPDTLAPLGPASPGAEPPAEDPAEPPADDLLAIALAPEGLLWTASRLGNLSRVDPDTGAAECRRFGRIDSLLATPDGTLWLGGGPGAKLYRYHPAGPWQIPEQGDEPDATDNPARLGGLATGDPASRGGALATALGKVYLGSTPDAGQLGGVLQVHDPETATTTPYPDVILDQGIASLVAHEGTVYGGTAIHNGTGRPAPTQRAGRIFAWDAVDDHKSWQLTPVPGAPRVDLALAGGALWGVADGTVFAVDTLHQRIWCTLRLRPQPKLPRPRRQVPAPPRSGAQRIVFSPDGCLYALLQGRYLYRICPWRGTAGLLLDHPASDLLAHPNGSLYLTDGPTLYRYTPPPLASG